MSRFPLVPSPLPVVLRAKLCAGAQNIYQDNRPHQHRHGKDWGLEECTLAIFGPKENFHAKSAMGSWSKLGVLRVNSRKWDHNHEVKRLAR